MFHPVSAGFGTTGRKRRDYFFRAAAGAPDSVTLVQTLAWHCAKLECTYLGVLCDVCFNCQTCTTSESDSGKPCARQFGKRGATETCVAPRLPRRHVCVTPARLASHTQLRCSCMLELAESVRGTLFSQHLAPTSARPQADHSQNVEP